MLLEVAGARETGHRRASRQSTASGIRGGPNRTRVRRRFVVTLGIVKFMSDPHGEDKDIPQLKKAAFVAERLEVSTRWVYRAAEAGLLPAIRLGGPEGPVRFLERDIRQWIELARARWRPGASLVEVARCVAEDLARELRDPGPAMDEPAAAFDTSADRSRQADQHADDGQADPLRPAKVAA